MIKLSKKQEEIMEILWNSNEPMIASEILKQKDSFNISTIQSTLKTLVKKKCIEVADIVYSGTVLSRSYRPIITREEVSSDIKIGIQQVLNEKNLFSYYVDKIDNLDTILTLEEVLKQKIDELEEKK